MLGRDESDRQGVVTDKLMRGRLEYAVNGGDCSCWYLIKVVRNDVGCMLRYICSVPAAWFTSCKVDIHLARRTKGVELKNILAWTS